MMKKIVKCKICGKEYNTIGGLQSHISHTHKLKSKEYYDIYLKKENEGICVVCGKPAIYMNMRDGYRETCSKECGNKNPNRVKKIKNTKLKKYGSENYNNAIKQQNTMKKKYGGQLHGSKVLHEKIKNTNLKKYGVENPFQAEKIKEKINSVLKEFENSFYDDYNEAMENKTTFYHAVQMRRNILMNFLTYKPVENFDTELDDLEDDDFDF